MRFRPANISLINRRHYLPRLLLILSSKRQMQKLPQRFEDVDRVTPYQGRHAVWFFPGQAELFDMLQKIGRIIVDTKRARAFELRLRASSRQQPYSQRI